MAKATVHGGASFEPEEESLAGTSGSTSSKKAENSSEKKPAAPQKPAPTTEPSSKTDPKVSSSVPSAAGDLPDTPSDKLPAKKAAKK